MKRSVHTESEMVKAVQELESGIDAELESYILAKIEERKNAKKEKDFAKADAIRDELAAKGIKIKDTREGTVYEIEG